MPASTTAQHRAMMRVLGPTTLELDGRDFEVAHWRQGPRSVVTLLAASPDRRRAREEAIDLLWPQSSASGGASNLRHALHLLRHAVGDVPPPVVAEGGWLALNPAYHWWIDLEEFEQLARVAGDDAALLERLLTLYRGEAVPENRYEDWAESVRTRTRRVWREAALTLAAAAEDARRFRQAARLYERILDTDPLDERVLQGLLRTLGAQGERTEALRRFAVFEQRLDEEIDVPPEEETIELVRGLRAETMAPSAVADSGPSGSALEIEPSYLLHHAGICIGRDREIAELIAGIDNGSDPPCRLTLITAGAGIGKTWLLGEIAHRARASGALVLAGGSYEEEGRLPYGPIHDALLDYIRAVPADDLRQQLGDIVAEIARIVPEIMDRVGGAAPVSFVDIDAQRLQLFSAVARAFERIAGRRPLLLLLDDLHCADEGTLQLLHFLARQPSRAGITIVGTYREEELAPDSSLAALPDHVRSLHLQALPEAELALLLRDRLGEPITSAAAHLIHQRSGGNPFFALQILRLLQQEGRIIPVSGAWGVVPGAPVALPPAVRDTIIRRVRHLRTEVQEVLALGAVLGRQFSFSALEDVWTASNEQLFRALDDALDAHVLAETEEGFVFRHPLLREAVYEETPRYRRQRLHERAGLALEARHGEAADSHAAELAHHFEHAPASQAERALTYLLLAGSQAEHMFEYAEAEQLYRRALTIVDRHMDAPAGRTQRVSARERLSDVLALRDRFGEALAMLEEVVEIHARAGDRDSEALALARIGRILWKTGQVEAGIKRIETFLADGSLSAAAEVHLLLTLALLHKMRGQYGASLTAADRALFLAGRSSDEDMRINIMLARPDALCNIGKLQEAHSLLVDIITYLDATGDSHRLRLALNDLGVICWLQGNLADSIAFLERARELAERIGDPTWIALAHTVLGHTYFFAGDWQRARLHLERGLSLVGTLSESWVSAYSYACLGALETAEGRWESAEPLLQRAIDLAERQGNLELLPYPHALLAEVDLQHFRAEQAASRLAPFLETESSGTTMALPVAAIALLSCGDIAAEAIARRAVKETRGRTEVALADALRALAAVQTHQGRHAEAEASLQEALAAAQRTRVPYAEGRALLALGQLYQSHGRDDDACAATERAAALFRALGARPWIDAAERTGVVSRIEPHTH